MSTGPLPTGAAVNTPWGQGVVVNQYADDQGGIVLVRLPELGDLEAPFESDDVSLREEVNEK